MTMYPGTIRTEKCFGWCGSSWPSSIIPAISAAFVPDHQGIEAIVAMNEMSPERRTIEIESPSTPT